jgi:15-cis-phytoene synthase
MPEKPDQQPGTRTSHAQGLANANSRSAASPAHPLQPTRYLAWLYSPPLQRPVLAALCEIESEVASSLRPGLDHHVAHTRLQWWREECERCARGQPIHPLTRELVKAYGMSAAESRHEETRAYRDANDALEGATNSQWLSPLAGISGFVDTAVWDLAGATFESRRELTAYCERWAAAMIEPVAEPTAEPAVSATTTPRWRALGAALREIELLSDLSPEAYSGRLRVPLDELERASVEPAGVAKPPWPASLVTLLRERHEALRTTVAQGVSGLNRKEQANSRGLLVWAALASQLSRRAQRALPNAITPSRYHVLADGWRAWRAARHAIAGNFRLG